MTTGSGPLPTNDDRTDGGEALPGDWDAVRADGDIQFAPVDIPPDPPRQMPEWLRDILSALGDFLSAIFEPIMRFLGVSWPVTKWVLIALAVAGLLYLLYVILAPYLDRPGADLEVGDADWTPGEAEALALLEDADRLAGEGRYDEATHLLLRRSVGQIGAARPDWIDPSSTAREIASIPLLPDRARSAFATIAERVERSLFALQKLGAEDWQAARDAYADFALAPLAQERGA